MATKPTVPISGGAIIFLLLSPLSYYLRLITLIASGLQPPSPTSSRAVFASLTALPTIDIVKLSHACLLSWIEISQEPVETL